MSKILKVVLAVAVLTVASPAFATSLDLTFAGAPGGTINGAVFSQGGALSGTGVFPAFVQIKGPNNGATESAYNTTVNNVANNGSSDTFNHEITVSQLAIQNVGGVDYYVFLLDINENSGQGEEYLSLDQIRVYTSPTANQSTTPNPTAVGTTLRYDLDAGSDSVILLNYDLQPGSGKFDMKMLVPKSAFGAAAGGDFVYLFSSFGAVGTSLGGGRNYGYSDGFEEWALDTVAIPCPVGDPVCQELPTVPEPASLALLGTGMALAALALRRRTRKA